METKTMITVVGEIVEIGKVQTFANSKFRKLQFVIRDSGSDAKYPNYYPFILKNEDITKLSGWKCSDKVVVVGYVNGNRWQKKDANGKVEKTMYFLEIVAHTIGSEDQGTAESEADPEPMPADQDTDGFDDDMPF